MLLWRLYQWRRRRNAERLRGRLGMEAREWEVVTRLAKRLGVPHEEALRMLVADGLRLRAASAIRANDSVQGAQDRHEEAPIVRMGKAMMRWATTTPTRELHLVDRTDGLHGVTREADGDGGVREVQAMEYPIPRAVVEPLLAQLRYSCGTDVLSDDIEVSGDLLVERDGESFRIEATFPPSGREDGLRAVLRAIPVER